MTAKEIVQALRCCAYGTQCEKCPARDEPDCFDATDSRAAAAIERLTAENAAHAADPAAVREGLPRPGAGMQRTLLQLDAL